MSDGMSFHLEGGQELERQLNGLATNVKRKVIGGAVRAAIRLPLAKAKAILRPIRRTGALEKSLGVKQKSFRGGSIVMGWVGVNSEYSETTTDENGKSVTVRPSKYAHLVEYGTVRQTAVSFIRASFDATVEAMVRKYTAMLQAGIDREVARK